MGIPRGQVAALEGSVPGHLTCQQDILAARIPRLQRDAELAEPLAAVLLALAEGGPIVQPVEAHATKDESVPDVSALQDQHVTASGVPATAAAPAPADDQKLAVKAHGLEASLDGFPVLPLVLGVGVQIELHTTPIPIRDPGVTNSTVW
jgi:hypothetical protein